MAKGMANTPAPTMVFSRLITLLKYDACPAVPVMLRLFRIGEGRRRARKGLLVGDRESVAMLAVEVMKLARMDGRIGRVQPASLPQAQALSDPLLALLQYTVIQLFFPYIRTDMDVCCPTNWQYHTHMYPDVCAFAREPFIEAYTSMKSWH